MGGRRSAAFEYRDRALMQPSATPRIFRILIQARDLRESERFYEALLGVPGRRVARGRVYFDCGPVILGILDYSSAREKDRSLPTEAIYLATRDIEKIYRRARRLGCLSTQLLHGDPADPAGRVVERLWGERSFYANDPSGNPLCFVADRTLFTGTPRQIAAVDRASRNGPPRRPHATAGRSKRRQRSRRRT
jgi:catechol 2,3-dioxygenase-like lactoylglutathione lyase family enzyme